MISPVSKCRLLSRHDESLTFPGKIRRQGFTLVEMLLVLVLISILTVVTLPNFVQSMRGNRLRSAVRSVVMCGRYSRSMAVLRQKTLVLKFDLEAGRIVVEEIIIAAAEPSDSGENEEEPVGEEDTEFTVVSRTELLRRDLDEIAIKSVEVDNRVIADGTASVIYSNNGRCTPYIVTVADPKGRGSVIHVDALSSARTEAL